MTEEKEDKTNDLKEVRAKRFHPSKFCGSIFEILRFAVPTMCSFIRFKVAFPSLDWIWDAYLQEKRQLRQA
jgi:hypothetical protein